MLISPWLLCVSCVKRRMWKSDTVWRTDRLSWSLMYCQDSVKSIQTAAFVGDKAGQKSARPDLSCTLFFIQLDRHQQATGLRKPQYRMSLCPTTLKHPWNYELVDLLVLRLWLYFIPRISRFLLSSKGPPRPYRKGAFYHARVTDLRWVPVKHNSHFQVRCPLEQHQLIVCIGSWNIFLCFCSHGAQVSSQARTSIDSRT